MRPLRRVGAGGSSGSSTGQLGGGGSVAGVAGASSQNHPSGQSARATRGASVSPRAASAGRAACRTMRRAMAEPNVARSGRPAPWYGGCVGTVVVKAGHVQPVWAGHPWVFAQAVERVEGGALAGDDVEVRDPRGNSLGRGLYSP